MGGERERGKNEIIKSERLGHQPFSLLLFEIHWAVIRICAEVVARSFGFQQLSSVFCPAGSINGVLSARNMDCVTKITSLYG